MTDRITYRQRVATVRGRARAQLATLRKERLARMRAGADTPDALSAAWLADGAAGLRWDRETPAEEGAPEDAAQGGEAPVLRLVDEAPELEAGAGEPAPTEAGKAADEKAPDVLAAAVAEDGSSADKPAPTVSEVSGDTGLVEHFRGAAVSEETPDAPPEPIGDAPVGVEDAPSTACAEEPPVEDMHVRAATAERVSDLGPLMLAPAAMAPDAPDGPVEGRSVIPDRSDAVTDAAAVTGTAPRETGEDAEAETAAASSDDDGGSPAASDRDGPASSDPVDEGPENHVAAIAGEHVPAGDAARVPAETATERMTTQPAGPSAQDPLPPVATPDPHEVAKTVEARDAHHDRIAADGLEGVPPPPPEQPAPPPACNLADIPGVGPGLVWMLQSAGVQSLDDLARAEAHVLSERLGSISRLLDLDYLIDFARGRATR
jgi:hypothetical protein